MTSWRARAEPEAPRCLRSTSVAASPGAPRKCLVGSIEPFTKQFELSELFVDVILTPTIGNLVALASCGCPSRCDIRGPGVAPRAARCRSAPR